MKTFKEFLLRYLQGVTKLCLHSILLITIRNVTITATNKINKKNLLSDHWLFCLNSTQSDHWQPIIDITARILIYQRIQGFLINLNMTKIATEYTDIQNQSLYSPLKSFVTTARIKAVHQDASYPWDEFSVVPGSKWGDFRVMPEGRRSS